MSNHTKPELISTMKILFNLDSAATKDLSALGKETLEQIYDSYIINAREANHAAYKHFVASSGSKASSMG